MLRINQLKLRLSHSEEELEKKIRRTLGLSASEKIELSIRRQSLDARRKPELFFVYSVDVKVKNEQSVLKKLKKRNAASNVVLCSEEEYRFPESGVIPIQKQPVIIGLGPSGLFCAYFLAAYGYRPILVERGAPIEERQIDVEEFWQTGVLKPDSNVQFGEGGAGTFSDGKLNTLIKDPDGRNRKVLEIFTENGAQEEILYVNKPHIGTDVLRTVIRQMRERILKWGGEIHFHTKMTDILLDEKKQKVSGICWKRTDTEDMGIFETDVVVLALGHSARDTFRMLYEKQIPMEAKAFAVGVRVEHPQSMIDCSQYGMEHNEHLQAASYKLTEKLPDGRGVYSFCMCPGGYVVNASSEEGMLAVNGMSYHARDSKNANSAIVVTVNPEDYGTDHPLAGIEFQRKLEQAAFLAGNGKIPTQRYGDFYRDVTGEEKERGKEQGFNRHMPCMKGAYEFSHLKKIFPDCLSQDLVAGIEKFNKKIRGFSHPDAIVSAVESRTSSPVRILRDNHTQQSRISGIFPCGEGAGYAGGITSAAADGIKIAEAIRQIYQPFDKREEPLRKK